MDYRNTIFETVDLTKIHGEPTMAMLLTLQNELKANAHSVQSTLGGGNNGHLGLYQIAQAQMLYMDALCLFDQVNNVKRELKKQVVAAVDKKYIKAIRNSNSNHITLSIQATLDHLFDNYGDVTAEELQDLHTQVENLSYNIREPVDNIFTELEDLEDISKVAKDPITKKQMISIAYLILQKMRKYHTDLKGWNRKAQHQKTWANFKSEIHIAQKELCCMGELTVEDSINHTELVNMVTEGSSKLYSKASSPIKRLPT
eukprot:8543527-Ditylum_brightwellii.AAC.2